MFYEVRVYDPSNHIKKIIRTKELSKRHWVNFCQEQTNKVFWQEQTKKIMPDISKKKLVTVKTKKAL